MGRQTISGEEILPYIIAQVLGAIAGAGILYIIASGKAGFSLAGGFASNGFGDALARAIYELVAAFVAEVVMTFFFLIVILGCDARTGPAGFCSDRDRPLPDADPPDLDPGDKHVGQSGPQHGPGDICSGLGD